MNQSGSRSGGGAFGALLTTVLLLVAFSIFFNLFLIVPFFIFIGGVIAMVISDRRKSREDARGASEDGA